MRQISWSSQMRKGVIELAVLGLLPGGAKYGSQLVDELAEQPALSITGGTIYPLLSRLRQNGLVESRWQESPVGPPRKYYALTPAGRAALAEMSETWRSVTGALDSILEGGSS